ncbi:MAG TPA: PaaI family thioesterase [Thermohalobaculum sp.]|nr:PaaI family thioesterase [Thermohalobaculum sp.]
MTEDSGRIDGPDGVPPAAVIEAVPFAREIGMQLVSAGEGTAVVAVPYDARLVGDPETGVLHGGVISALLDMACGLSVLSTPEGRRGTATLDLRIDYMRPATVGRTVQARAECYRMTRSIAFVRALAYHDRPEHPVASAAATFILEPPREATA